MLDIKILTPAKWTVLRDIRLEALRESPQAFLSTHEKEAAWGQDQWLAEFARGDWSIGFMAGQAVSLLGATRLAEMPRHECYLEYIWVSPEHRGTGLAQGMLSFTFSRLQTIGVQTTYLYVLDGNDAARRLYEKAGFTRASEPEPLTEFPGRSEERLKRSLRLEPD